MLLKLCVVASHCYPPGLTLQQELSLCRDLTGCWPLIASPGIDSDLRRHGWANSKSNSLESLKLQSGLMDYVQHVKIDCMQVSRENAVSLSFGNNKQYMSQQKVYDFFKAAAAEVERDGCAESLLADMMHLQSLVIDVPQQLFAPSLFYPNWESDTETPLMHLFGDLGLSSKLVVQQDGQVLFNGSSAEMKDVLSVVSEFYFSKKSLNRKSSMLVPHYSGVYINGADSRYSVEVPAIVPLKSREKIKVKRLTKKKSGKRAGAERNLYQKNYLHACESLLSLISNQRRRGRTAISALKKSGPEVPELLTQFSAGIAGTGVALLFSVVCKVASGRVPFCSYKLLNTSFGLGLIWLSWAVNKLRDTIVYISKHTGKLDFKDEELLVKVDKNMKDIRRRAAALLVVAVLRFA